MTRQAITEVGIRVHSTSGTDAYNNPVGSWAAPATTYVYGIAPKTPEEQHEAGRDPVIKGWTLYAPATVTLAARDRVDYDGDTYEVEGDPAVWTNGPYSGDTPGLVAHLKRAEG